MSYQRTRVALPEEEISTGIEQLLRDYSIESLSSHLAQVNADDNSFFIQIEPHTDFCVSHRREIIDQEYQDFLGKIQKSAGVNELTGFRVEKLSSENISSDKFTNATNLPLFGQSLTEKQPRFERENISFQKSNDDFYINNLLSKSSIQLVESNSKVIQDLKRKGVTETKPEEVFAIVQDLKSGKSKSNFFSEFNIGRPERYAQNSDNQRSQTNKSWFQEAADRIREVSQVVREVSQNRVERLQAASEQKAQSTSTMNPSQDMSQTTRAWFDGKTYTVQKGNEPPVSCPAFSGSEKYKPIPEGNYCVRAQGEAQSTGGILGFVAKATQGNLDLFQNSNREKWFLNEPQYCPVEPRTKLATHAGRVSEGCATITDSDCFTKIADIFNSSKKSTGLGYDGYPPGSVVNGKAINNPLTQVSCVATLTVNYSGEQGIVQRSNTTRVFPDRAESYGLGVTPSKRRGFDLGVSDSYKNSNPKAEIPGVRTPNVGKLNLGVDLKLPSIDLPKFSPELLGGSNQLKQSTPNKSENPNSGSSESKGDGGADKKGGGSKSGESNWDYVGKNPSDNIA